MASITIAISAICACGHNATDDESTRESSNFARLSDSVKVLSKNAPLYCDSLMATAKDSDEYYEYFVLKGNSYIYSSTPDSALPYAYRTREYANRCAPSPRTMSLLAMANTLEASIYHLTRQNATKAVELYNEAYSQIMQSDYKTYAPDIAANMADAYIFVNDIPTAAKWYRKALYLVDSLNLPQERNITLYMGLGQIYTSLEDYASAQSLYEQTEKQFSSMKPNMQTYFLMSYGNHYYYKGDYGNALSTFKRLERHLKRHNSGNDMDTETCKINIADVYLNLGKTDSAAFYVEEPSRFFEANHVDVGIYYANTIRIGIAIKKRQYAKVKSILDEERTLDMNEQSMRDIRCRYLSEYYAATGNYKQAFDCTTENQQQKDSIERSRHNMRASEIMARFTEDTLRLHYELELNERNAEVARSRASLWTVVALLAVVLSALVSGWFIFRKRKVQRDMDVFMLKLATIRQRISPHFVFNVLNSQIGKAQKDDANTLIDMAKLIRQNLDLSSRDYVTLYEELNFVRRYVELQRSLLSGHLDFTVNAPDEDTLEEIKIPPMFVQILVENAIKHGLKCVDGPKTLTIDIACTANNCVTITVTDNGPGFDITRRNPNSTHTGLDVISKTMAVMNRRNRRTERMTMAISNIQDTDGHIVGCQSKITIPLNMRYE